MVIVVINNKGGTGKTTTCVNLSAALANLGYRVLLIDLDSQASASLFLGINYCDLSPSVADVLFDGMEISSAIRSTSIQRLDLLTGGIELAHSDLILADIPGRENRLAESLEPIKNNYDFILCDCAPSLSMLPINALVAADRYIVTVTPEYLALEGLITLMDAVEKVKKGMGVDVELLGILFTMVKPAAFPLFNRNLKHQSEIINLVREHYGNVFKTTIKRDVKLAEAPSYGTSIFEYAPGSRSAKEYAMLAEEVIERCGINRKEG